MFKPGKNSLKLQLIRRLVPLQGGLLTIFTFLFVGALWAAGLFLHHRDERRVIEVLGAAIVRGPSGSISLRGTGDLQRLRRESPNLWFMVRDRHGHLLTEGSVPTEFASLGLALDGIGRAKLGLDYSEEASRTSPNRKHFSAQMRRVVTDAGDLQIIATLNANMSDFSSRFKLVFLFFGLALTSVVLMTIATLVATPMVVRRAISGLDEAARHASKIDIDKRGARLPLQIVPIEVAPLVKAVNDALSRLDEGYERHKRFLADAAHELRTPIAILTTRLDTLPQGTERTRLVEDVARLSTLTDQLLDLQRLEQRLVRPGPIDLVAICARVVADLAPMAIEAGYQISLQSDAERIDAWGDEGSLERAVINLVQNAIQHGGRSGMISVAVRSPSTLEVSDHGPGIPASEREQVFEPFHRLRPLNRGAGLGLSLVKEIVQLHHGVVSIEDAKNRTGACFRIELPLNSQPHLFG